MRTFVCVVALMLGAQRPQAPVPAPTVDHHQHLFSAETIRLVPRSVAYEPLDAAGLVVYLDATGIQRAAVLSTAYQFGNPNRPPVEDEYAKVKAENDWTSRQVARYPDRLRGLCGVNPLKDYALDEIARCAQDPSLRSGLKLHFGNSDVDLDNPAHVRQLQRVFRAANDRRMAVVVHMRSSVTMRRAYGAKQPLCSRTPSRARIRKWPMCTSTSPVSPAMGIGWITQSRSRCASGSWASSACCLVRMARSAAAEFLHATRGRFS
jgi:hypothetical protein